jgi:hypothetical protein
MISRNVLSAIYPSFRVRRIKKMASEKAYTEVARKESDGKDG